MPDRIQRTRRRGTKLPPNTICCTRPGEFENPFRIGTYAKIGPGHGRGGMMWLRTHEKRYADQTYEKVVDAAKAVEMYREYRRRYPFSEEQIKRLRAADHLACWCGPGDCCHVDVILEIIHSK